MLHLSIFFFLLKNLDGIIYFKNVLCNKKYIKYNQNRVNTYDYIKKKKSKYGNITGRVYTLFTQTKKTWHYSHYLSVKTTTFLVV